MQTLRQKAGLNKRNNVMPLSNARSLDDSITFARIWIDGYEIGGYLTYTALDAKSYFIEPVRSTTGVIENLNSYATFLTPQVTLEFKYMDIRTYRIIMKIIQQRNEHIVKYYDIVSDKMVTKKMYFKPEQLPTIFQRKLEILAVTDYKLELVGTNADMSLLSIVYHANYEGSSNTQGSGNFVSGEEIIIGDGITIKDDAPDTLHFEGWNTSPDGDGTPYLDGYAYVINENETTNGVLDLYAQWVGNNEFTLSYNYGVGATYKNENNSDLNSKTVTYGEPYGTLPTTQATVEYNDEEFSGADSPYQNPKWYMNPVKAPGSTEITASSIYNIQGNSTIYQIFETQTYTIHFDLNAPTGSITPASYNDIVAEYGAMIYEPQEPTREGYTFEGWYRVANPGDGDNKFVFNTMPPSKTNKTTTLYAKWIKNEE